MQSAQKLRIEAYLQVCCNDEVEVQRRRWTFYETINIFLTIFSTLNITVVGDGTSNPAGSYPPRVKSVNTIR
jgi:hypothetical protein